MSFLFTFEKNSYKNSRIRKYSVHKLFDNSPSSIFQISIFGQIFYLKLKKNEDVNERKNVSEKP